MQDRAQLGHGDGAVVARRDGEDVDLVAADHDIAVDHAQLVDAQLHLLAGGGVEDAGRDAGIDDELVARRGFLAAAEEAVAAREEFERPGIVLTVGAGRHVGIAGRQFDGQLGVEVLVRARRRAVVLDLDREAGFERAAVAVVDGERHGDVEFALDIAVARAQRAVEQRLEQDDVIAVVARVAGIGAIVDGDGDHGGTALAGAPDELLGIARIPDDLGAVGGVERLVALDRRGIAQRIAEDIAGIAVGKAEAAAGGRAVAVVARGVAVGQRVLEPLLGHHRAARLPGRRLVRPVDRHGQRGGRHVAVGIAQVIGEGLLEGGPDPEREDRVIIGALGVDHIGVAAVGVDGQRAILALDLHRGAGVAVAAETVDLRDHRAVGPDLVGARRVADDIARGAAAAVAVAHLGRIVVGGRHVVAQRDDEAARRAVAIVGIGHDEADRGQAEDVLDVGVALGVALVGMVERPGQLDAVIVGDLVGRRVHVGAVEADGEERFARARHGAGDAVAVRAQREHHREPARGQPGGVERLDRRRGEGEARHRVGLARRILVVAEIDGDAAAEAGRAVGLDRLRCHLPVIGIGARQRVLVGRQVGGRPDLRGAVGLERDGHRRDRGIAVAIDDPIVEADLALFARRGGVSELPAAEIFERALAGQRAFDQLDPARDFALALGDRVAVRQVDPVGARGVVGEDVDQDGLALVELVDGIINRARHVVDDLDDQRALDDVIVVGVVGIVGIGDGDREDVGGVVAVGVGQQFVGIAELPRDRMVHGEHAELGLDHGDLADRDRHAVDLDPAADRDQRGRIAVEIDDHAAGLLAVARGRRAGAAPRAVFDARLEHARALVAEPRTVTVGVGLRHVDVGFLVGDDDRERGGRFAAVVVDDDVGEGVGLAAGAALEAFVAPGAIGLDRQRAPLALDDIVGAAVEDERTVVDHAPRLDAVGPGDVGARRSPVRPLAREHVARGAVLAEAERDDIVDRGRRIVEDVDGQRRGVAVPIGVGDHHGEDVADAVVRIVRQRVAEADGAIADRGDGEDPILPRDLLANPGHHRAVDRQPAILDQRAPTVGRGEDDGPGRGLAVGRRGRTLGFARVAQRAVARGQPVLGHLRDRVGHREGLLGGVDVHLGEIVLDHPDLAEFGRGVEERGRRQQVAQADPRPEVGHRDAEVAPARGGVARGGLGLFTDQQRGEGGGGNLDTADDELGHEHRAAGNDHDAAVGQLDHEVAPDDGDVIELDARRQDDRAAGPGSHAHRVLGQLRLLFAVGAQRRLGHRKIILSHFVPPSCRCERLVGPPPVDRWMLASPLNGIG